MKKLVIGMAAAVDSGKTTLSEAMLYRAGAVRKLGRVDHQTAFLDTHPMERARGITIFSHQARLTYQTDAYTLLDTPGHVDFSAETERILPVLDYAVLVISGTDGVQSHTETLWNLLERFRVPVFLFVNKMDLPGADKTAVLEQLQSRLGETCVDFSDSGSDDFYERIALCQETWMETYLEQETIPDSQICQGIAARKLMPCYFGAALHLDGVTALLDGLHRYTREPVRSAGFGAKVFKIASDHRGMRLSFLKLTGGQLQVRDSLSYSLPDGRTVTEKVSQIRLYDGEKYQTADQVTAGMVCAVTGFSKLRPGQGLGAADDGLSPVLQPILKYQIGLPKDVHPADAMQKLSQLEEEDPALHLVWEERTGKIQVQLMGEIQLEVLRQLIQQRFGMDVSFDAGQITYQETIAAPVEGVGHYEPLRHYAEVHLLLEPLPPGSGLQFASSCREDDLDRNWQNLVLSHLKQTVPVGVLTGSPVTDLRITLCAGKAHLKHTEGGDFGQAADRALRNGLRKAENVLLEPWYQVTLELPPETVGRAMTDLQQMGGTANQPELSGDLVLLRGTAPAAALLEYGREVLQYTHGAGRISLVPDGYRPCQNPETVLAAIGYDCDRDTAHPADSVFCAHGGGFSVPWDEVERYMHLPFSGKPQTEEPAEPTDSGGVRAGFSGSFSDDKELMAIFERTYGKIRRDPRHAMETPREPDPEPAEQKHYAPPPDGESYLLVDGYNVIFAWEELKTIGAEHLDTARAVLMRRLSNYCGYRQCHLILVFDAYQVTGQPGHTEQYDNIEVVYTKESETADAYIERTARALSKEHRVRVATSDGMEQMMILGSGALRVTAEELRLEVAQAETELRAYAEKLPKGSAGIREKGKNL